MNIIRITDRMKAAILTLTGKEISHFEITDPEIEDQLASMPESGMGYQKIICHMKDGSEINGSVTNGTYMDVQALIKWNDIAGIEVLG